IVFVLEETDYSHEVATAAAPAPLRKPQPFFIELGRNKLAKDKESLIFLRNQYTEVTRMTIGAEIDAYVREHTGDGWGLYTSAFEYQLSNPGDSKRLLELPEQLKVKGLQEEERDLIKDEIKDIVTRADLRGDFYLDFDDEKDIRKAQQDAFRIIQHLHVSPKWKIPMNMMKIYFSGKKGIHVIVPYQAFGIEWHPFLDQVYRIMAEELVPFAPNNTLDMKVYERRRQFRIPRSMHASTGAYKVPMELKNLLGKSEVAVQELAKDQNYGSWIKYEEPKQIMEATRYFKECEQKFADRYKKQKYSKQGEATTLDFEPPCSTEMIENGPVKGSRNVVGCLLVAYWKQRGMSEQETWDELVQWND
ncbi:MAG: hypothetical protein ACJ8MO_10320, partial [Bacillus sp. (in: firmicutes)]